MTYLAEDFGAKADGITDNTEALQQALNLCSEAGGGIVLLGRGTYISGTLQIKSNTELRIEKGAVLEAIFEPSAYPEISLMLSQDGCNETTQPEQKGYSFLYSFQAHEIRLSGEGIVYVGGERFRDLSVRPFLLRVIECSRVSVEGLSFLQSASWCFHIHRSEKVKVEGLKIRSEGIRNGDGIDIDSSSDVEILNCDIQTCDDAICLKTTTEKSCTQIRVRDCVLESSCSAFKIGTETVGDFSNIEVSHCSILGSGVVAIKITAVDGGSVRNVSFSDLSVRNATGPIFLATGDRRRNYMYESTSSRRSTIENVTFRRIEIETTRYLRYESGKPVYDSGQGIVVSGAPKQEISNIFFEEMKVSFWGGIEHKEILQKKIPYLTNEYPECHKLGVLPSYGYYFQYAKNIQIINCKERLLNTDVRPLMNKGPGTTLGLQTISLEE